MTTGQALILPTSRRVARGDSLEILTDIYQDDVNIVIWHRYPPAPWKEECHRLLDGSFSSIRVVLSESKLKHLGDVLPELAQLPHLKADIQQLAEMFFCLFETRDVGLRLTRLTGAMCPKFHVDRVPCRLITTYCGGGTQWLPHHTVNRDKLGAGSGGLSDADSGLYTTADDIQALAVGDVALLKGELWEGNEDAGLVHRSPSIEPGQKRLLLTLDFA